ncbi:DUF3990 domain-containing protein [Bacillus altitudinis]|uniref:DUF3990 domain-containing protein n=1 Tax=Bacillus altitudinis TaxID=293387 RepID=UPI002280189B|nr:DUF3990 domain-containing protein [Bacillus altitudinis]MCY7627732.1 DUF3990 domain-containing protein [Bacillus altitudinis]MDX2363612.1 DUF3990 domain-containing protein [Bacillus altitudinis]
MSKVIGNINTRMYHGTTSDDFLSLEKGVKLSCCKPRSDFGQGFYLTSNFKQASVHADKLSRKSFGEGVSPVVFVYEIDLEKFYTYHGLKMNKMDTNWAKFIYENRSRKRELPHYYDWVFGGVADGKITEEVLQLDNGTGTISNFFKSINKYQHYNQLSIHNQEIFDYNIITKSRVVIAHELDNDFIVQKNR